MTPEEKQQRIEQIRERNLIRSKRHGVSGVELMETISDIDFLLSLVKSQEAEIGLLRVASAEGGEYGATVYDGNGNYTLLAQNAINRNVDWMRSACVEKVRDWLGKTGFDYGPLVREMESLTPSGARNDKD